MAKKIENPTSVFVFKAAKELNQMIDESLALACAENGTVSASFRIAAEGFLVETVTIPHKAVVALIGEGMKRVASKDTAGNVSDETLRKVIAIWSEGYADAASKKKAERTPAASTAKFRLPFGRLLIEKAVEDQLPLEGTPEGDKAHAALAKIRTLDDEKFILWVEAKSQGDKASKPLVDALARLTAEAAKKAEAEKAQALAELEDLDL
jgi:hypothetical protein